MVTEQESKAHLLRQMFFFLLFLVYNTKPSSLKKFPTLLGGNKMVLRDWGGAI